MTKPDTETADWKIRAKCEKTDWKIKKRDATGRDETRRSSFYAQLISMPEPVPVPEPEPGWTCASGLTPDSVSSP